MARQHEEETLYKTLIPLARALEAGALRGSLYALRVVPTSPVPVEQANRLGQQLADTVERFLTTYSALQWDCTR